MLRLFHRLILAAVLFAAIPARPALADPADIAAAARSVVRVVLIASDGEQIGLIGHGSGVAIAPDLVLTNAHVIAPAAQDDTIRIGVVPSEGNGGMFARVIAASPGNDLALLKLERGGLPAATLFTGAVADGSDVHAIGYPGNVDQAQGLDIGDIMTPITPVKTRGSVSGGRSSRAFDTILHTASIGAGNSGGPLVDDCGRVVGVNSFGTLSGDGDSEFYFAVSMREISRFLTGAGIRPRTTGVACRSLADLDRAEAERRAGLNARDADAARDSALRRSMSAEQALRSAQYAVIDERENRAALALLALVLALGAGGWAIRSRDRDRTRDARIAAGIAVALLAGALFAWLSRPGFGEIDARATALSQTSQTNRSGNTGQSALAGDLVCVIDPARSRVTVSDGADLRFAWRSDGCVNGSTQYGRDGSGWIRVLMPAADRSVAVARFDPAARTWTSERYLPDLETMSRLRAARADRKAPACGAPPGDVAQFGQDQLSLAASIDQSPNERLVYTCAASAAPDSRPPGT